MADMQTVQWFPGHMAKTRRMIGECLSLVDCVTELADARVPQSSRNPELDTLCAGKPRILLLTKSDLADSQATADWVAYFQAQGIRALAVDCKSGTGINGFLPLLKDVLRDKIARNAEKDMNRPIRSLVVGIPNVGKSTFINKMAGARRAKAENRPGVTRGRQWVTLHGGVELLDTPGVLWPKFEDKAVGEKLAFIGSVKDTVLDTEELAARLLELLAPHYAETLTTRFKCKGKLPAEGYALLESVARGRGFLISGGEADTQRAADKVLEEYRAGKLGQITLEWPED
ncbi:MAG: ribosome biogenesis GTPase YlqF [Ethanoligenens sp.]|uniref:ribosome biogenesis GTPase YlqF n=1 Tax=Ethanoligenens sp. TaxID=2099655 RepID=UPI0039EBEF45